MTPVAVLGYASVDHVATVGGDIRWGWTSRIVSRSSEDWPRPGGCPFYVARALVGAGLPANVVTWIGDDDIGKRYESYCRRDHVGTDGIYAAPGATTLTAVLLYNERGDCACLVDFGSAPPVVTKAQEALLRNTDTVVVTVGPPECSVRALELLRDDAMIAWVAKNDPSSFPLDLRANLGRRARYIFCNSEERAWINEVTAATDPDRVIVETRGADPIVVCVGGVSTEVPVAPLLVGDATGAGDTLAGATLAAVLLGERDPIAAVRVGSHVAHQLLARRVAPTAAHQEG